MTTILAVDDNRDNLTTVSALLRNLIPGSQVVTAQSGKEGIEKARADHPDVILLDVRMPGMDGWDACRGLKADPDLSHIPVIMLTAVDTDAKSRTKGLNIGADAFLTKPFDPNELIAQVRAMLRIKRAEDLLRKERDQFDELVHERTKELRSAEKYYRTLFNNIADAIFIFDPSGKILDVNEAACNRLGYAREELLKMKMADICLPGESGDESENLERSGSFGSTCFETVNIARNGASMETEICAAPIDHDGRPAVLCVARDISKRKRAENALRASEEGMRRIIESSPIGIRITRAGRYTYVNPAFVGMFGYEESREILGRPPEELYAPESVEYFRKRQEDRRAGRPMPQSYEAKGLRKDGKQFDIAVYVTDIEYHGAPVSLVFVIDVGMERELEAQLRQAQKMEAIGTLSGGIAHDFNNVLGVMLGFTQLALITLPEGGKEREYLEDVLRAGNRARDMVLQILAFSRGGEQGRKPVQISHIVKETLNLLRVSIPSTVEIRSRIESRNMVLADPTQIHQVLLNLCGNAAHAMSETGGVLDVKLADVDVDADFASRCPPMRSGAYLKLTVSDTGHGMSEEVLARIFDSYFTTKKIGEGTGLGLAVVQGIVKNHGGVIAVESQPGKGSTFDVFLPRYESRECDAAAPVEGSSGGLPGGRECILFVDDEESLCYLGRELLSLLGYEVVTRKSGVEALNAFQARPDKFDLVITDFTMPKMTGLDLAEQLIAVRADIPVILCSGDIPSITPEKVEDLGIRELIAKPMVINDLAAAIRRVLDAPQKVYPGVLPDK